MRLRAAGKRVIAYAADLEHARVLHRLGGRAHFLDPVGSGSSRAWQGGFFRKNALDRFGIRADLVRIGDYKSSPEMWTRSGALSACLWRSASWSSMTSGSRLRSAVADGASCRSPASTSLSIAAFSFLSPPWPST